MTGAEPNGPHGRELGAIGERLKIISETLGHMRTDLEKRDEKLAALEQRFSTFKERIFALGAIVAVLSWNGGALTSDYLKKAVTIGAHHERPDKESQKPVDLASYHCGERRARGWPCDVRP
jgi:hypothetical protein